MPDLQNQPGLTSVQASKKLKEFGPNQIFKATKISFFGIARQEITEPMILLLFFVGIIYSFWGKPGDAITIFVVITLLVLSEVFNEYRAKKAIDSLEKIASPKTKVLRDNKITEIDSQNIVPGDILILTSGTKISADAKLIKPISLSIDESALTGESFAVDKNDSDEISAGTIVVSGQALAEVITTGKNTKIGKIAAELKDIKAPKTALQQATKSLATKMLYSAVFFSTLIPVIGLLRGQDFKTMVLTGLSLAFAIIPEELPIIITMVLGLGAYKLSKNNFLVKKLKAAETLGNATVIVTDKTGTITESLMKITAIYPEAKEKEIIGNAVNALPEFLVSPLDKEIINYAQKFKVGLTDQFFGRQNFDNEIKMQANIKKMGDGYQLFASGAPEVIFSLCQDVSEQTKRYLLEQTAIGQRVIAIAKKTLKPGEEKQSFKQIEKAMEFCGLISFEDPPRAGVKETIAKAAKAGINTIMVTGDHPATAAFVAREVGIISQNQSILTGSELDDLTDEQLRLALKETYVFARTTPQHKYRIVKALQSNGEVVAVTGDGINDSLALKGADIGIAMGIRGTDVAKEAAEVVLADDNYVTIAQGIFEGRKFFDNLRKGVNYYLTVKVALISIFLLPVLIGIPMPFAPIQIILLELFMDLAASAGFVSEPKEKNIYNRPPRNAKENILNNRVVADIFIKGLTLFFAVMVVYFFARSQNLSLAQTQTFAFTAWIIGHVVLAFISRSDKESLYSLGIFKNHVINIWAVCAVALLLVTIYLIPALGKELNIVRINFGAFLLTALATTAIVSLLEVKKLIGLKK